MRRFLIFLVAAVAAILIYQRLAPRWGGTPLFSRGSGTPGRFTPAAEPRIDPKEIPGLTGLDAEYTKLVSSVVPSVVSVTSSGTVRVPVMSPLERYFGWQGRYTEQAQSSLGSGVIVSKEGHILTNHHVIAGMQDIQVQLTDGREFPATLIGSDPNVDIAVLKVDVPDLQPLPLADSDKVQVGQMVMAVGNPYGLQETVTRGILSAKGRSLKDSGVQFFQTDAAVNPGNSGGPLLNMRGEIIGINSAIYSQTGSFAGISFAIPANVAKSTLESIIKTGRPKRGTLGVNMVSLTVQLALRLGLRDARGAVVTDVDPGSPADKVGMKRGDVIHSFNGEIVLDANDLRDRIARAGVGAKVQVGVVRGGREQVVTMEIVESKDEAPKMLAPKQGAKSQLPMNVLSGVKVEPLGPGNNARANGQVSGVVVSQVDPNSSAANYLQDGDIIVSVNKQPVPALADYEAAVKAIEPGKPVLLFVVRGRESGYVVVKP